MATQRAQPWHIFAVLVATMAGSSGAIVYSESVASKLDRTAISIASDASLAIDHLTAVSHEIFQIQAEAIYAVQQSISGGHADPAAVDRPLLRMKAELAAYVALPFYPQERALYDKAFEAIRGLEFQVANFSSRLAAKDAKGAATALRLGLSPAAARANRAVEQLVAFNTAEERRLAAEIPELRKHANGIGNLLVALFSLSGVVLMFMVVQATRRYALLLEEQRRLAEERAIALAAFGKELEAIHKSTVTIARTVGTGGLEPIFRAIADEARALVRADYCALGYGSDPARPFERWTYSGMSAAEADAIGAAPRPVGILGAVIREGRVMRLADLSKHPDFRGLPEHHPSMGPILGIPIAAHDRHVGSLFLTRRPGRPPFSEDDERVVELLAAYVGVAIENARLYLEAQSAVRAREDLLAVVSHDLRNPLSSIRLATEMMHPAAGDGKVAQLAALVDRSAGRMLQLVDELLDAAKIEAGRLRALPRPEKIASLVEEAGEMFSLVVAEKDVTIGYRFLQSQRHVLCERALILRVFSNLIGNAVKFTPRGGSISIGVESLGELVHFSVADSGPGVPPAFMPHVFDRYWQREDVERRGAGLGLYICKGFVEAHGGRIWVESVEGQGSVFHFTLPAAGAPAGREALV